MKKWEKLYRILFVGLPAALYLSYYPVIPLGSDATMNFELSVALLWLVATALCGVGALASRGELWAAVCKWVRRKWLWMLFPVWVTLSVIWSLNMVRGALTVGVVWLIMIAVVEMIELREMVADEWVRRWFPRVFVGATLLVCVWCVAQCVMDVMGVSREYSLLCLGCTSRTFGFPHPNGFAIEPQFMGNLLIAPAMTLGYMCLKKQNSKISERECSRGDNFYNGSGGVRTKLQFRDSLRDRCKNYSGSHFLCSEILLFCFSATLFLTFSRGAIYAFLVGVAVMSAVGIVKKMGWKRLAAVWGLIVGAFMVTLVAQGVMAEVGPTNDTFGTAVAKVLNHLSLGVVDVRGSQSDSLSEKTQAPSSGSEVVEKPVENSDENRGDVDVSESGTMARQEAIFDGYAEESTNIRVGLTNAALAVWMRDFKTLAVGVGIGGAGEALYKYGFNDSPKEIVQNEYASVLVETGAVGAILAFVMVVLGVRFLVRRRMWAVVCLVVAYCVSLFFFSGVANALQIYVMPAVLAVSGLSQRKSSKD